MDTAMWFSPHTQSVSQYLLETEAHLHGEGVRRPRSHTIVTQLYPASSDTTPGWYLPPWWLILTCVIGGLIMLAMTVALCWKVSECVGV